jgi:protein-tyrosine phosphatase
MRDRFSSRLGQEQDVVIPEKCSISLDGALNFRDVGGYRTADSKQVKQGQIFRSGHLADLTQRDHAVLRQIGIRLVCDFRSKQEVDQRPNRLPNDTAMAYIHMPIVNKLIEPTAAVARIRKGDISWFSEDFVIQSYLQKIDDFADVWRAVFTLLADKENRPLVFHCTAGKDRTGVCAALILLALGVPEETVIQDYLLSNSCIAPFIKKIRQEISELGINPEKLEDFITAPHKAISALIAHLTENFGSASNYLIQKVKLPETQLQKFRQDMLE